MDRTTQYLLALYGQSNTNPLNYPINLLEDDLCKTKVLKWLFDLCLIGWMIKRGPDLRELARRRS